MPLPNSDDAVIDPAKLRDYLLSTQHPLGRFASPALVDNEIFLRGYKYLYAIAAQ